MLECADITRSRALSGSLQCCNCVVLKLFSRYLFHLMKKEKHHESLMEKLCHRLRAARSVISYKLKPESVYHFIIDVKNKHMVLLIAYLYLHQLKKGCINCLRISPAIKTDYMMMSFSNYFKHIFVK